MISTMIIMERITIKVLGIRAVMVVMRGDGDYHDDHSDNDVMMMMM